MPDHRLYLIRPEGNQEITGYLADGMNLKDSMDALSTELSLTVATNQRDPFLNPPKISPGDKVLLTGVNGTEIMRGIITTSNIDGSATAFDFGFYLNKSEVILQCNKVAADQAIRELCKKAGVPVATVPPMPTLITKNFIGQTPASILQEIVEQVTAERGTRYFFRVEGNALAVRPYPTTPITAYAQQPAGDPFPITWLLGSVSGGMSIDELKNSVTVVSGGDKVSVLAAAKDQVSVNKYGWLQKVETATEGAKKAQAANVARNTLARLNKVTESYSISNILGSDAVRCGVMLAFNSPGYGIVGNYIVTDVTHTYGAAGHTMSLTIERG